ncbi:class I SAM-dependent methyltransferase [Bacillus ectoiniformans]|uniref:class I SAM-dependent methyltransferase n=1 Tax=Bacillus ectoiniformans TaxID=1494429 RepID=UPI00195791CB|nr:class I SAM-dependent methyltransferase [Bacillus ectoiniformans]
MIITTSARTNETVITKAITASSELGLPYVKRNKRSIVALQEQYNSDCIVVAKERMEVHLSGIEEPFFFHPNSASFRLKRMIRGERDPLIEAAGLTAGMSFLDCTLGLASDSIAASCIVGENGKVTGVEGNPVLAYIVSDGLKQWPAPFKELKESMHRIQVVNRRFEDMLASLPDDSYDVVYFDPMFEEAISSKGIDKLRGLALYEPLRAQTVTEAQRVAKKRVILKDHFRSSRFETLGFHQLQRPSSAFHFGVIDCQ